MKRIQWMAALALTLTLIVGVALASQTARADIVVSTGLDAGNTLIGSGAVADAHWTVDLQAGGIGAAQTVYPNNADWYSGWLANGPSSDWIARNANISNNGPAPYTFYRTFDLTGYNLATVSLSGSWAIDDSGVLSLNGNQISSLGGGNWGALTAFSVPTASPFFNQGSNTLTMTMTSDDQFLEAVRLQGSVTGALAVPEPSALVLAGAGLGLFGLAARLRRNRSGR